MHFVWRVRSAKFQSLTIPSFSDSRIQLVLLGKVSFCQENFADSEIWGYCSLKVVESFPNRPDNKEKPVAPLPATLSPSLLDSKKLKAIFRVSEIGPNGKLRPQVLYLIEDLDQIRRTTRRFSKFPFYNLEGKIKPLVEFLLELGVPKSDIPTLLNKSHGILRKFGCGQKQWAKVIYFLPALLSYSVEDKLRPIADYFRILGVDVAVLILEGKYCSNLTGPIASATG